MWLRFPLRYRATFWIYVGDYDYIVRTLEYLRFLKLWVPPLLCMALIFVLSHLPHPPTLKVRFQGIDKLYHCIEYAGFSFWLTRAFLKLPISNWKAFALTMLVIAIFGATDEWHQSFVRNRSPDITDWIADNVGGILGTLVLVLWQKFWRLSSQ